MFKRSRSNDGSPNRVSRVLHIAPGLMASLIAEFAEVRERAAPKTYHGPKAARGCPASAVTDEQVLSIRRMRDWHGMSKAQIVAITGLSPSNVDNFVDWKTRVHLDPGPRPTPAAPEEAAEAKAGA